MVRPALSRSSRAAGGRRATATPAALHLIQSGGVVGGRRVWTIDLQRLAPAARRALARLQKNPPKKSGQASAARDRLVYSFVLHSGGNLRIEETALPPSLRTVVARVIRRAPVSESETTWA